MANKNPTELQIEIAAVAESISVLCNRLVDSAASDDDVRSLRSALKRALARLPFTPETSKQREGEATVDLQAYTD